MNGNIASTTPISPCPENDSGPRELVREYILGAHTGDEVCNRCGESFSPAEIAAAQATREH